MAAKSAYFSRLSPVECTLKAQAAIVAEAQVVGMATDELVLVRMLKGNMFQTVARAKLAQESEGTGITLTAGMDRIVFVFACIFLAAFVAVNIIYLVAYLRIFQSFQFSDQDRKDVLFVSLPLISMLLGVGLAQLGRYLARDEAPMLRRLLIDAMEAKPKGGRPAPQQHPSPSRSPEQ